MPLWAAVAIVAAAYCVRAYRLGTLAPQLPGDYLLFGLFALVLAATFIARRVTAAPRRGDDLPDEVHGEDQAGPYGGHGDEVPSDRE